MTRAASSVVSTHASPVSPVSPGLPVTPPHASLSTRPDGLYASIRLPDNFSPFHHHPSQGGIHVDYWSAQPPTKVSAGHNYFKSGQVDLDAFREHPSFDSLRVAGFQIWHAWEDSDFVIACAEPLDPEEVAALNLPNNTCVARGVCPKVGQRWLFIPRVAPFVK